MDRSSVLIWIALALSLVGTVFIFSWNGIFDFIISKELRLTPTSRVFSLWENTPIPLTLDFYFFNWTNPDELLNEGYKPNLVEMGPYRFKESLEKTNITWNANNTISFRRKRRWYYDADNSNGTLNDNVTTLNPVALSAAHVSRYRSNFIQYTISSTLRMTGQKVHTTKSIGEFLCDGYSDPLLTVAAKLPHLAQSSFKEDKFAWFYNRNDSAEYEGVFNVETGEEDISKIGVVRSWNFKNHSDFYENQCNHINGSIGDLYPPGQTRDKPIHMFSAEFCKSIRFDYLEDTEVLDIPAYLYVGSKAVMDNGTTDPNTRCNCGGVCVPQGVLNISACQYGAPGFVSYPHFLDADPYYREKINGMNPDPSKHRLHITLEPTTGIPLDVAARFQINLLLQPSSSISLYHNVPTIFFPMIWFEEVVTITPELANSLKMLLSLSVMGLYCSIGLLLLGLAILVFLILPKVLRGWPWSLHQHFKRKPTGNNDQEVVFSKENGHPLKTSVNEYMAMAPEEDNLLDSKNTDVTLK